jgi:Transposase DDE domain
LNSSTLAERALSSDLRQLSLEWGLRAGSHSTNISTSFPIAGLTPAFEQSRCDRKRVEMLFAHLKRILKLDRLRLRGPRGAQDEFTLAAIAQNLRRLAKLIARPPPAAVACAA